ADTFVLAVGEGIDTIVDFEVGIDLLGLKGELSADELSISQVGSNAEISLGSEMLAILTGVNAADLTADDPFVMIA
ncbi:alkaline phosphatase domain protein, partial [Lyngbya aestuarii BL J]